MTGSFKERGAANLLLQLDAAERGGGRRRRQRRQPRAGRGLPRGAARHPCGHRHARVGAAHQGDVRPALRRRGHPGTAPTTTRRTSRAREVEQPSGASYFVHPFDDARVDRRPGHDRARDSSSRWPTWTRSWCRSAAAASSPASGWRSRPRRPDVRVIGVQAEAHRRRCSARSQARQPRHACPPAPTIADGIAVRQVGELTLALASRYVDEIVTVTRGGDRERHPARCSRSRRPSSRARAPRPLAALLNRPARARRAQRRARALRRQHRRHHDRADHRARPREGRAPRALRRDPPRPGRGRWRGSRRSSASAAPTSCTSSTTAPSPTRPSAKAGSS